MKGLVCVNKPCGCTSFDVIARLRKILNIKKIGHSGTLDPLATGVLPVFVGKATKAIQFLQNTEKVYIAGFKLGQSTDTLDCSGNIVFERKSEVSLNSLKLALEHFKGSIVQIPPKFSAIKINGIPAYRLARCGKDVNLKARNVNIFKIECLDFDFLTQSGRFFMHCSSGTYVRAICRDLGARLGVGCVLTSLVRTKACGWSLSDCFELNEIEKLSLCRNFNKFLFKIESLFYNLERVQLNSVGKRSFLNGAKVKNIGKFIEDTKLVAVYFHDEFLGLGCVKDSELKVVKSFI